MGILHKKIFVFMRARSLFSMEKGDEFFAVNFPLDPGAPGLVMEGHCG